MKFVGVLPLASAVDLELFGAVEAFTISCSSLVVKWVNASALFVTQVQKLGIPNAATTIVVNIGKERLELISCKSEIQLFTDNPELLEADLAIKVSVEVPEGRSHLGELLFDLMPELGHDLLPFPLFLCSIRLRL